MDKEKRNEQPLTELPSNRATGRRATDDGRRTVTDDRRPATGGRRSSLLARRLLLIARWSLLVLVARSSLPTSARSMLGRGRRICSLQQDVFIQIRGYIHCIEPEGGKPSALHQNLATVKLSFRISEF